MRALGIRLCNGVLGCLQHSTADLFAVTGSLAAELQHHQGSGSNSSSAALLQQQQQLQQQRRHKHNVRMVLLKDHEHLGQQGDIVSVNSAHARYTLFPSGQADYAIPSVLRELRAQGLLSDKAMEQLRAGFKEQGAAAPTDPSTLPLEQQLPQVLQLLGSKTLVVSRRFNRRLPEQPMVGSVSPRQLSRLVSRQLGVVLPPELILMAPSEPIQQYGSYKVPLNLRDSGGRQVELSVLVRKTYGGDRPSRLRLFGGPGGRAQPAAAAAAAAAAEQGAGGGPEEQQQDQEQQQRQQPQSSA